MGDKQPKKPCLNAGDFATAKLQAVITSILAILAITLAFAITAVACDATINLNINGNNENPIVIFSRVTAINSSGTGITTDLELTFSETILGLSASDIILDGSSGVTKGTVIRDGTTYYLPISGFTSGGSLSVAVSKTGYTIIGSPRTVNISGGGGGTTVTLNSVTPDGSATQTTSKLTLIFSQIIPGLSAADITLSGVSGVNKGILSNSGTTYTLPISGFTAGGSLTVDVAKLGYTINGSPKTATIYYYTPPPYGIKLSETAHTFPAGTENNYTPTLYSKMITVTNIGSQPTGTLNIALNNGASSSFSLSTSSIASITTTNGTGTFNVEPKPGLTAGTYTDTVTVSGSNSITANFTVSFTVNNYGISLSETAYTFTAGTEGSYTPAPKRITVTNTGSLETGILNITLSGADASSFELSKSSITTIAAPSGTTDTFDVAPKSGLTATGSTAKTYTATVTVSGTYVASKTFDVSFTVNPAGSTGATITITFTVTDGTLSVSPSSGTITYAGLKAGSQSVTLTFSGTYTSVAWDMDGISLTDSTGATLTINSSFSQLNRLVSGSHVINVIGTTANGQKFSGSVSVTVNNN